MSERLSIAIIEARGLGEYKWSGRVGEAPRIWNQLLDPVTITCISDNQSKGRLVLPFELDGDHQ
jgi:hypothetical protein